jgi:hypothetical protein
MQIDLRQIQLRRVEEDRTPPLLDVACPPKHAQLTPIVMSLLDRPVRRTVAVGMKCRVPVRDSMAEGSGIKGLI